MRCTHYAVSFRERDERGQWRTKEVLEAREMEWDATRGIADVGKNLPTPKNPSVIGRAARPLLGSKLKREMYYTSAGNGPCVTRTGRCN
jgi:hypothetical protein